MAKDTKTACGHMGKHVKTIQSFSGGGKVQKTREMPSGAQQYTRGETAADRLRTISDKVPTVNEKRDRGRPKSDGSWERAGKKGRMVHDAFMDETRKSLADRK